MKSTTKRYGRKRLVACGLVTAALAGVAVLPATGWLVRQQAQVLFSGPVSASQTSDARQRLIDTQTRAAQAHPDDFGMQLALALRQGAQPAPNEDAQAAGVVQGADSRDTWVPDAKLQALRGLKAAYANRASLHAAILRDLSLGAVKLAHRKEVLDLQPPRATPDRVEAAPVIHPEALREWDQAAVRGEELDPQNAFFPLMRAVGLFALNEDAAAVAEIEKAATLPHYDDYVRDEATGGWALTEAGQNGQPLGAVPRVSISAAILLPHYSLMRNAARLATMQAVYAEQTGRTEDGFAIRQALVRCGARMRTDSNWIIGGLVGNAISATAQARPGGAPPLPKKDNDHNDQYAALTRKTYEAYLNRIGHPDEVAWVEHEADARQVMRRITDQGLDQGPSSIAGLVSLMGLWFVGMALLGNAVGMVVLGAAATRLARTRRIQSGERLHPAVAWGMGLSALPIGLLVAGKGLEFFINSGQEAVLAAVLLVGPGLGAVAYLRRRDRRVSRESAKGQAKETGQTPPAPKTSRPSAAVIVATMASVALTIGMLLWMSGGIGGYAGSMNMLIGLTCGGAGEPGGASGTLMEWVSFGALSLVPALTWTTLAIRSKIRRVPVSVGTVRGFSRVALPLAAVLSLLYVVVVGVTGVWEARANQAIGASLDHEGQACAQYAHLPWPSFAPDRSTSR